jgi:hypothetical protein
VPRKRSPYRDPAASNDGVPLLLPAFRANYIFSGSADELDR